jgi:hypothetical protein
MEQTHFFYRWNGNNIIGCCTCEPEELVPKGIPYYIYTLEDVKGLGPVEAWEIEGEPDGYGENE